MYHLEITRSTCATEKRFNSGRKIQVIINDDYENLDIVKNKLQQYNISLEDSITENNSEFFVEQKEEAKGEKAQYLIRVSQI